MKEFDLENSSKINAGFKIPEGYFEDFETKILEQISQKQVKIVPLFRKKKFWFSAIAALFIMAIGVGMYLDFSNNKNISNDEYLLAFENSITTDEIAEHLTDDDITKIEQSLQLLDSETTEYAKEYLQ